MLASKLIFINMEKLSPDHKSLILFQNTIIFSCFNLSYVGSAPRHTGDSLTLFFSRYAYIAINNEKSQKVFLDRR